MSEVSDNAKEQELAEAQILALTDTSDLHVFVPLDANIAGVLSALEKHRTDGHVEDFGITAPNLEDVFWELGKKAESEKGETKFTSLPVDVVMNPPSSTHRVLLMLARLAKVFFRDIGKQFRNNLYAFLYVSVAMIFVSINFKFGQPGTSTLSLTANAFSGVIQPLAVAFDGSALPETNMVTYMNNFAAASNTLPKALNATGVSPCLSSWLMDTNQVNVCLAGAQPVASSNSPNQAQKMNQPGYVGAYGFVSQIPGSYQYTLLVNQSISLGMTGLITYANNAIWAAKSPTAAKTLSVSYNQWIAPISPQDEQNIKLIVGFIVGLLGALFFSLAIIIMNSKQAMNLVIDKKNGIKQLQILMGVTRIEYLVTYCLWDLIQSLTLLLIPIIVTYALDNYFASAAFILVLVMYLIAIIPVVHLFCYTLHEPDIAYTSTYSWLLFSFLGLFILNTIYGSIGLFSAGGGTGASICLHLVMLHPTMALNQALNGIVIAKVLGYNAMLSEAPQAIQDGLGGKSPPTALVPFLYLLGEAIVFFGIYAYVEYSSGSAFQKIGQWIHQNFFRCVWLECCYDPDNKCCNPQGKTYAKLNDDEEFVDISQMPRDQIEDDDVRTERGECDAGLRSLEMVAIGTQTAATTNKAEIDAVLAAGIHMEYPPSGHQRYEGTVAVKDFSLRIKKKECFALLGSNGAGKTTVMAILLKQLQLTKGNIFINGVQLWDVADSVAKTMSYCPQHNALFDSLTARECLEFYCRIRGVSDEKLALYVDQWLDASDLSAHEHTWCGDLSGGNKRKLSLAISLVGNPEFIVLDEPSAGVDPAARRKLHWLINATKRRGATLVLTTVCMRCSDEINRP